MKTGWLVEVDHMFDILGQLTHWGWCPASITWLNLSCPSSAQPQQILLCCGSSLSLSSSHSLTDLTLVSWCLSPDVAAIYLDHRREGWLRWRRQLIMMWGQQRNMFRPSVGRAWLWGETVWPDVGEWQWQWWWWARWYWAVTESWPPASRHRRGWATTPTYHRHHHHHHHHYIIHRTGLWAVDWHNLTVSSIRILVSTMAAWLSVYDVKLSLLLWRLRRLISSWQTNHIFFRLKLSWLLIHILKELYRSPQVRDEVFLKDVFVILLSVLY